MESSNLFFKTEDPGLTEEGYLTFVREFEALSGIRLDLYKEKQMKRRINTLITRKGLDGYEAFLAHLKASRAELNAFVEYITINVTEFFRTPDQWAHFEEEALADLLNRAEKPIKVWSCACSTGEEPYSLAMSLLRRAEPSCFRILATDIDYAVLEDAREGLYHEKTTEPIPEEELARYFVRNGSEMQASDELKACVEFRRIDLLKDDFPQACDLIVCRNVLIYFTEEAKDAIYWKIRDSLKTGGYLFTGNTEQIIYYKKFGMKKIAGYLYQKL